MSGKKTSLDELRIDRSGQRRSGSAGWIVAGIVAAIAIVATLFWWFNRPKPLPVRTVAAQASTGKTVSERTVLNASGYVTARREATVSSKVTGKVVQVLIEEGMRVEEGQVLARLDDVNVKASLALAEAHLHSAKAALEETRVRIKEAEINLRRTTDLARNSISAQAELDRAEAEVNSLKARLQQQEAQVTVAERDLAGWQQHLEDTVIRAPFGGIVTSKNAQPGEMISPVSAGGGFTRTGICTIVDMSSLEVEIDVNEGYINRVQPGQSVTATLDAYPDWKIPCRVIAIIPTADRQKSTVRVRVGFDALDPRILPEMSIKVAFQQTLKATVNEPGGVSIPKGAVQKREGRDVVMVVREGRAERRAVSVSATSGDTVHVSAGLTEGERVLVDWPPGLTEGTRIIDDAAR